MKASRALTMARRRAGLTQRDLARMARVLQSTVARIESGRVDPTVSMLERLLRHCGERLEAEMDVTDGVDHSLIHVQLDRSPAQRLADLAGSGGYDQLIRNARVVEVGDIAVTVAAVDHVIKMKRAAGRSKDVHALPNLLALRDELERREK